MSKPSFFPFPRKRSLRRDENGSAAIEFALVSLPFFGCLFAIIEIGLLFLAGQVLDTSVADASRMILTGQAQTQNFDADAFKNKICTTGVQALFNCNNIKLDVQTVNDFTAAQNNLTAPVIDSDTNTLDTSQFKFQLGAQCSIVVVRVFYEWPTYVPGFGLNLANLAGNKHLLMSTAAFRNEPYGSNFC